MKTIQVDENEETDMGSVTKFVHAPQTMKTEPLGDVMESDLPFPFDMSKIPRGLRTKRRSKFNVAEAAPPRPNPRLNTGVFDDYLGKIWKSFSDDKKKPFAYFDSLWFSLHRNSSSKDKVLTWIKKQNIFSKAYVFVPIVCWGHWSLLIFCHFGAVLKSTTRLRCMLLLDSLEIADPRRLEPDIRRFVQDIYETGGRPESKDLISQIPLLVPKVPQQRDGNECGNFVLYFINLFLECAPEKFSMKGYPYFMKKDWFTFKEFDSFCERLNSMN